MAQDLTTMIWSEENRGAAAAHHLTGRCRGREAEPQSRCDGGEASSRPSSPTRAVGGSIHGRTSWQLLAQQRRYAVPLGTEAAADGARLRRRSCRCPLGTSQVSGITSPFRTTGTDTAGSSGTGRGFQARAAELGRQLDPFYRRYADFSNPEVVTRVGAA